MTVPAPLQMLWFGPGVGVQEVMFINTPVYPVGQSPEIRAITTEQQTIFREFPVLAVRQAFGRLIQTDHKMIVVLPGKKPGTFRGTAGAVQQQKWLSQHEPAPKGRLKCLLIVFGDGPEKFR